MRTILIVAAIIAAAGLGYWYLLRPWADRWGATDAEVAASLPGDAIAPDANLVTNRAVTVHAPAARVYPWLVQLGQGRGGMYSYEWLENLVGCDLHNVYQIRPDLQEVQAGQIIRMGPKGYPMYRIHDVEPGQAFVLQPGDPKTEQPGPASWALVVQEQPDGTTRLISRQRQRVEPGLGNAIFWRGVLPPMAFVMEQKMLRTIRDLAEAQG